MIPTDPPAPRIKRVSPSATPSWRSTPTAASTDAGSAPASLQDTCGGLGVHAAASAYSPYPPSDGSQAATSSPTATPLDLTADGVNDSGGLEPEDRGLRQRENPIEVATADLQIRWADAGDTDLDSDLSLGRFRHRNVFPLENVWGPIFS